MPDLFLYLPAFRIMSYCFNCLNNLQWWSMRLLRGGGGQRAIWCLRFLTYLNPLYFNPLKFILFQSFVIIILFDIHIALFLTSRHPFKMASLSCDINPLISSVLFNVTRCSRHILCISCPQTINYTFSPQVVLVSFSMM